MGLIIEVNLHPRRPTRGVIGSGRGSSGELAGAVLQPDARRTLRAGAGSCALLRICYESSTKAAVAAAASGMKSSGIKSKGERS